jgi:hypothetical protein
LKFDKMIEIFEKNNIIKPIGEIPEWPKGTDCKSVGLYLRRFESCSHHQAFPSEMTGGPVLRSFNVGWLGLPLLTIMVVLKYAGIAQLVERQPSKL